MSDADVRPVVLVSRCLGFASCRYDGAIIRQQEVQDLVPLVTFAEVCPEEEIGLGTPRDPVRLVDRDGEVRLVQPASGKDLTTRMTRFASRWLRDLKEVDGAILKSRSPSCGLGSVKVYAEVEGRSAASHKGVGLFAAAVQERWGDLALIEDGQLRNRKLREHFLTRLYTMARFRQVQAAGTMRDLVRFHATHKLLLLSYNQSLMRELGRVVGQQEVKGARQAIPRYREGLVHALGHLPRKGNNVNVLEHAAGHFKEHLTPREKRYFRSCIRRYLEDREPLSTLQGIVGAWIERFEREYLADQVYFRPFPEALVRQSDTGKGRQG